VLGKLLAAGKKKYQKKVNLCRVFAHASVRVCAHAACVKQEVREAGTTFFFWFTATTRIRATKFQIEEFT
jgi:hypothetical protein